MAVLGKVVFEKELNFPNEKAFFYFIVTLIRGLYDRKRSQIEQKIVVANFGQLGELDDLTLLFFGPLKDRRRKDVYLEKDLL